jgi:hypothetical protein
MQTGNIPSHVPPLTLAWDILEWAEENIVQPDGEHAGDPWKFTNEQIRFLAWFYALDKRGKWLYRSGSMRRSKGWGKARCWLHLQSSSFVGQRASAISRMGNRQAKRNIIHGFKSPPLQ